MKQLLITTRHAIRTITAFFFVATVALLVAAVLLRSFGEIRLQLLLTFIGFGFGGTLLNLLLDCYSENRPVVILGSVALGVSLTFYLLLVWGSGWRTEPTIWRIWWVSSIATLSITHLGVLKMMQAWRSNGIARAAPAFSVATALLLAGLAARELLSSPGPIYLGVTAVTGVGALVFSILARRRFIGDQVKPANIWRRSKLTALGFLFLLTFAMGYYLGHVSAPQPSHAELFPSVLRGMSREHLEAQIRSDLTRLKTASEGIEDLSRKAEAFRGVRAKKFESENRDYYLPEEGDEIRSLFGSYLRYRTALLRLLATYSGFESVRDPDTRARCFMVGFAAAITVFENSLKLVNTYGDDERAQRKLNEPEPEWGIPGNMFNTLYKSVSSSRNINVSEEMADYFNVHRKDWRERAVWSETNFTWLEQRIDRGLASVRQHSIAPHKAWYDLLKARVQEDVYTPVYAVQSVASEWIGDMRIIERKPFISIQQIEEIESLLKPGDIFLERRNWFLSNAFLPGFWPHAALYVGRMEDLRRLGIANRPEIKGKLREYGAKAPDGHDHTVIEAVSEGVIFNSLTHSMHADYVAVLRPRLSDREIGEAIVRAFSHHGKPYDFDFNFETADKLVCTELVYRCYQGMLNFTPLPEVMGRKTLPAVEIARKFVKERSKEDRDFDFVLFLDGDATTGHARRQVEDEFCASAERSQASFNE